MLNFKPSFDSNFLRQIEISTRSSRASIRPILRRLGVVRLLSRGRSAADVVRRSFPASFRPPDSIGENSSRAASAIAQIGSARSNADSHKEQQRRNWIDCFSLGDLNLDLVTPSSNFVRIRNCNSSFRRRLDASRGRQPVDLPATKYY